MSPELNEIVFHTLTKQYWEAMGPFTEVARHYELAKVHNQSAQNTVDTEEKHKRPMANQFGIIKADLILRN